MGNRPTTHSSQRIFAVDFIRLAAMILMIQGHTLYYLVGMETIDANVFPWNVWHFVRGLTAPTFLLVSGIVHMFANKRDHLGRVRLDTIVKRGRWGIALIAIGMVLQLPVQTILDLPHISPDLWQSFLAVNILQLTGAGLLAIAFLLATTTSERSFALVTTAIGVAVVLLAPLLNSMEFNNVVAQSWLTFNSGSLFPLFPYVGYMFVGTGIGYFIKHSAKIDRFAALRKFTGFLGVLLFAISFGLENVLQELSWHVYPQHNYYHSHPNWFLQRIAATFLLMFALTYVFELVSRWRHTISSMSSKSLHIYVAHLLILYSMPYPGAWFRANAGKFSIIEGIFVAVALVSFCLLLAWVLRYLDTTYPRLTNVSKWALLPALGLWLVL